MKKEKRNWSAIQDYQGGNFGQRSFYTREEWIEQCFEWTFGAGMPEIEDMDEDEREYYDYLCEGTDESLMAYIEDMWEIQIRETTWLKVGNQCYYKDYWNEESGIYTILNVPEEIEMDSLITITNENDNEQEVCLGHLYGLTDETCPKCGKPLYVSDLCSYPYVCLECDENF